jgi:UDP-3-O-[3-hydroxymyristoyl] glucosamine N-acyltransferase
MKTFNIGLDIAIISQVVVGEMVGRCDRKYTNVAELAEATEYSICFYENEKYITDFQNSKAGLILVPKSIDITPATDQVFYKVEKPYLSFMTLVSYWLSIDGKAEKKSISPQASISPTARISDDVHISPFAVICDDVSIGEGSFIGAHCVIMSGAQIGKSCKIYPHVTIYSDCKVGDSCIVHAGAVIGADGFGFINHDGIQIKVPQIGNVIIGDDVEIGANTTIDRSTLGTTLIEKNTKIDNLVQIGHNCRVEAHSILCSQVGLAGHSHIGKWVYLAGQVGVSGHLKIEDHTLVGAQSGVANALPTGKYFGSPAISAYEQKKIYASLKDLPAVVRYVKKIIKKDNE